MYNIIPCDHNINGIFDLGHKMWIFRGKMNFFYTNSWKLKQLCVCHFTTLILPTHGGKLADIQMALPLGCIGDLQVVWFMVPWWL